MLTIKHYVRPQTLEEAWTLCQKRANVVLGGMLWLKMEDRTVDTAIDLCDLGLDTVEETPDAYRIGAMVPLRVLETHPGLRALTRGAMADCLHDIVGVQFRNCATVGGTVYGRFGFSDPLTLLLALDASVELYRGGVVPLRDFVNQGYSRDILTHLILPRTPARTVYLSRRNTATDFPVLTCAVSLRGSTVHCAVGARPMKAARIDGTLDAPTEEAARAFAESVADRLTFGSNLRGSADYRRELCRVLVRRALTAALNQPEEVS
ncbi:MAG: FAD binding domain-containing protein [Gemmiger sp.]|uniref:FAD binding domain-containing protein n=1 Tax=Gemmiger sp. TaxID=2049027 RepID=UPI002E76A3D0|nr:FAD binding domain-containing protein [Gemmiger sp.]MEE0800593.1 FAD binding domain-containing protein [Gemmiger sp.]